MLDGKDAFFGSKSSCLRQKTRPERRMDAVCRFQCLKFYLCSYLYRNTMIDPYECSGVQDSLMPSDDGNIP